MFELLKDTLQIMGYQHLADKFDCSMYGGNGNLIAIGENEWYVSFISPPENIDNMIELCGKRPKELSIFFVNQNMIAFPTDVKHDVDVFTQILNTLGFVVIDEMEDWYICVCNDHECYLTLNPTTDSVTMVTNDYDVDMVRTILSLHSIYSVKIANEIEAFGINNEGESVVSIH